MNVCLIIAAGSGQRTKLTFNKVLYPEDDPMLYRAVNTFDTHPEIDEIVISVAPSDRDQIQTYLRQNAFNKKILLVEGGSSRQQTICNALESMSYPPDTWIAIHNAANPLVTQNEISKVFYYAKIHDAAIVARPEVNTLKNVDENHRIVETVARDKIWHAQTPQVSTYQRLLQAHQAAKYDNFIATDDSQLLERIGIHPYVVLASDFNFKITDPKDLILYEMIVKNNKVL